MTFSKRALLPLLSVLPYASAWGSLGHTTVAYIAQNFVSNKTAQFAQQLLNDTTTSYLARVAIWADSYRYEAGGEFSAVYHYIDALDNPPQSCNVDFERDCPEEGCIVSALANYSTRALQTDVDLLERQKAMKWIIHFIGDIHQPLHVENLAIGGNLINVTFAGVKTNLHAIWDTQIPAKRHGNYSYANALTWATNLTAEIKTGQYKKLTRSWLKGINGSDPIESAMTWARDTNKYVCSTVMPNGTDVLFGKELSGAYYESAIPTVEKQIAKAGYILAAWLNTIVEGPRKKKYGNGYKRGVAQLEPWMLQAREARRAFGGDCGCTADAHDH